VFGLIFEVVADRQKNKWVEEKKAKKHSEEFLTHGLWSKSRHPNYFGEATLWSGIALAAAGLLVRQPAQAALGLSGGLSGQLLVAGMCAASPAFVSFLLLKISGVPMSENKYDKRYGDRKDYQKWKVSFYIRILSEKCTDSSFAERNAHVRAEVMVRDTRLLPGCVRMYNSSWCAITA